MTLSRHDILVLVLQLVPMLVFTVSYRRTDDKRFLLGNIAFCLNILCSYVLGAYTGMYGFGVSILRNLLLKRKLYKRFAMFINVVFIVFIFIFLRESYWAVLATLGGILTCCAYFGLGYSEVWFRRISCLANLCWLGYFLISSAYIFFAFELYFLGFNVKYVISSYLVKHGDVGNTEI